MPEDGGELITETLDFGGGREVSVFMPPTAPTAILFAGDGQLIAPWGADLVDAGLPATIVVGVHRPANEMARIREYSPGQSTPEFQFDPESFAAHERFFVEAVPAWVSDRFGVDLPPDRTAMLGVSAGGELALAIGLRHPTLYGAILCASPGAGFRPPDTLPSPPRTYLVAGNGEPFFLENARRWADALSAAGAEVVFEVRDGEHGDPFWREELPRMVTWAFGDA